MADLTTRVVHHRIVITLADDGAMAGAVIERSLQHLVAGTVYRDDKIAPLVLGADGTPSLAAVMSEAEAATLASASRMAEDLAARDAELAALRAELATKAAEATGLARQVAILTAQIDALTAPSTV
ncbi:hypothetical protein [Oharaeibacter diazotrophicus]|uniref:Uncharacterized protein n=1 Tax=Oharaeibacter diazotrophicus TaxID=1920512 RepID=A0A4R6RG54_9HYPH|nr:hypothetical protein [Oharaeibacter diazotrophicus]TDP85401.1 hypothetical protein EDD54_2254 [Oharaeibacter diazotrophicus]BBE74371.1 hypothetical protein OHA_1_04002 [Pleomorphomonas sp. SM30]GLS75936.1 hypothetical protein GCM10007904_12710 [Oharaeibacter diazotrophicus]